VLTLAVCCGCGAPSSRRVVTLATTTSVANSGLLNVLLPVFERSHRVSVQVHQAGSGRALSMLGQGQADIVISHAPDAERAALLDHPGWRYQKLMFNQFVIVGPAADSATVAKATSAPDAMRRIVEAGATFLSRGDESGTHERERQLWKLAGVQPAKQRLIVAGGGMGSTLRIAGQMNAYTLTDSATFDQVGSSTGLVRLFEGDALLLNTYAVVTSDKSDGAPQLADWLTNGDGRRLIDAYRPNGRTPAFQVWPQGQPASDPALLPRARGSDAGPR
jgi:tungstate transport system substrate-binding protein